MKTAVAHYGRFFIGLLVGLSVFGCSEKETLEDKPVYTGPIMRMDSVHTFLSDSALVMIEIKAPVEEVFENNNREWPEGLLLRYFDKEGAVSSTFESDYAFFDRKENLYKGTGNVIVKNVTNGDELRTEELYYDPKSEQFYTERFVTILTEDEVHTGEGLTANKDFTSYKILKPAGTFTLEESMQAPL